MTLLFDRLYKKLLAEQEDDNQGTMTFYDYIVLLLKNLNAEGFVPPQTDIRKTALKILEQPEKVKKMTLRSDDETVPPIVLYLSYKNPYDFEVKIILTNNPLETKTFKNSMYETIFKDLIEHIKKLQMNYLSTKLNGADAVQKLPPSFEGEESSSQSALPQ